MSIDLADVVRLAEKEIGRWGRWCCCRGAGPIAIPTTKEQAMTFRIDYVWLRENGWSFNIKGIEGQGVYGDLQTSLDGRGLYLMDSILPYAMTNVLQFVPLIERLF